MGNMELIEMFKAYLVQKRKSVNTIKNYISSLVVLDRYVDKSLLEVTEDDIDSWINEKIEEGKKATTINRNIATFKTFYEFCMIKRLIDDTPMKRIEEVAVEEEYTASYFTKEELKIILKNLDKDIKKANTNVDKARACRNYALIHLAINTGFRVSELTKLKLDDVDMGEGIVTARNTKGKKNRSAKLGADNMRSLQRYLDLRSNLLESDYFFVSRNGGIINSGRCNTILSNACTFSIGDRTFHSLRHSYATLLFEKGLDIPTISKLLGHKTMDITLKIYTHLTDDKVEYFSVI